MCDTMCVKCDFYKFILWSPLLLKSKFSFWQVVFALSVWHSHELCLPLSWRRRESEVQIQKWFMVKWFDLSCRLESQFSQQHKHWLLPEVRAARNITLNLVIGCTVRVTINYYPKDLMSKMLLFLKTRWFFFLNFSATFVLMTQM